MGLQPQANGKWYEEDEGIAFEFDLQYYTIFDGPFVTWVLLYMYQLKVRQRAQIMTTGMLHNLNVQLAESVWIESTHPTNEKVSRRTLYRRSAPASRKPGLFWYNLRINVILREPRRPKDLARQEILRCAQNDSG